MRISTLLGAGIITLAGVTLLGGALIAPHASGEQFRDFLFAPPMRVHLRDSGGDWHAPFVYPLRLVDRVERRYEEDRTHRVSLVWFSEGKLVRARDERDETMGPLLLLGADSLGRDVFSRLVVGAPHVAGGRLRRGARRVGPRRARRRHGWLRRWRP